MRPLEKPLGVLKTAVKTRQGTKNQNHFLSCIWGFLNYFLHRPVVFNDLLGNFPPTPPLTQPFFTYYHLEQNVGINHLKAMDTQSNSAVWPVLSMAATAQVIWLCACVRYWPYHVLCDYCFQMVYFKLLG